MEQYQNGRIDSRNEDGVDPLQVFQAVRELFPQAFFFQSSSTPQNCPELTVLGLEVEEVLAARGGRIEIVNSLGKQEMAGTALDLLAGKLQAYRAKADGKVPFENGGAFGAIGYDLVREIEPRLLKSGYFSSLSKTSGKLTRKPTGELQEEQSGNEHSQIEGEILFVKNLIVFDHQAKQVHLILKSNSSRIAEQKEKILQIFESAPRSANQSSKLRSEMPDNFQRPLKANLGRDRFKAAVLKLKNHIRDGDIFQAVLAERFECEISASAFSVFRSLRQINPAAYSFYFPFQNCEFFGASPEALIKIKGGRIETHPIAGTRPRGLNSSDDLNQEAELVNSIKESAEHLMLVDLARNDVGRVAVPGTVEVQTFRQVMRLSNVMHLISKVDAKLNPKYSELEAFKACFPAGTLSGAPKIRAMEILSQLEQVPRGLYGGAIVAFDFQGGMDSCIAIRSMEISQGRAILRAGAGVVADSDPESEYQEIEHKLATLRQALAISEQLHQSQSQSQEQPIKTEKAGVVG